MKIKFGLLSIVLSCFLMACGGGGGSSAGGPPITDPPGGPATTEELAVAAKETTAQILASESYEPGVAMPLASSSSFSVADILKEKLAASSKNPNAASSASANPMHPLVEFESSDSIPGGCGGSADYDLWVYIEDVNQYPAFYDWDYQLNDFCVTQGDYEIVYNGWFSERLEFTDGIHSHREYVYDFAYAFRNPEDGEPGTVSYSETCYYVDNEKQYCSPGIYESETTSWKTSDLLFSGDSTSGYDIKYTMTDRDGNAYTLEFNGLTLCDNGNIGKGSGTITFNEIVIIVDYISCDEFTVTFEGNVDTYLQ